MWFLKTKKVEKRSLKLSQKKLSNLMIEYQSFKATTKQIAKSLVVAEFDEIGHLSNGDKPFQGAATEPLKAMKIIQSFV